MKYILTFLFLCFVVFVDGQGVLPKPKLETLLETTLDVNRLENIYYENDSLKDLAFWFNDFAFKGRMKVIPGNDFSQPGIFMQSFSESPVSGMYRLNILDNKIQMVGGRQGLFYAMISLKQLMMQGNGKIPSRIISDYPDFRWRGMHLDVSRHFFSVDFIKKYIDILAFHKLNTFHWHLTDDQGWRIEIKKYPRLTQKGSDRAETILDKHFDPYIGDGKPYGGYYTQEEIREIVSYAGQRFITVIPEIEMPGHAQAALSAYPQYSCEGRDLEPWTKWGVSDNVFCVKDSTFQFLFNILDEVLQLFPSPYIHIGGDEVPKNKWKTCPNCQKTLLENRLNDVQELQSYFITRVDSFLTARGRNTIGWDEILEGGLAPNAAVMSWRGEAGGIEAADKQHHVVMTPGSHCYFDHYQGNKKTEPLAIGGFTPLKKVYSYNPIPDGLPQDREKYILGAQGNVWTEYIVTPEQVMYMALPRLCALSEVLWTGSEQKDFQDFARRLQMHFFLLDSLKIKYSKALFDVHTVSTGENGNLSVELTSDYPFGKIYYTLDGTDPDTTSGIYRNKIPLRQNTEIHAGVFQKQAPLGNVLIQKFICNKATAKKIEAHPLPLEPYHHGGPNTLVNGMVGSLPWSGNEWLGWRSPVVVIGLDLGENMAFENITLSLLKAEESWIYLPESISVLQSADGIRFEKTQEINASEISKQWKDTQTVRFLKKNNARYLRIKIQSLPGIPEGKAGAGQQPWLFCSEVIVE